MLKHLLRSSKTLINTSTKSSLPPSTSPLTIYHNSESLFSHNLLNKLQSFNDNSNKFTINYKSNQKLSEVDYQFLVDETIHIHPDNKSIILELFHGSNISKTKLLKSFDLHHSIDNFDEIKNIPNFLVIDYNNKLLGNDSKSLDRIMSNYLNIGININNEPAFPKPELVPNCEKIEGLSKVYQ